MFNESGIMFAVEHLSADQLEAGLDHIRESPRDVGTVEMIVRRPAEDEREVLPEGELTFADGLVGDSWRMRGSRHTADGLADPDTQLNVMNSRCVALLARDRDRWSLAGDQLYLDIDLSGANLPVGSRLSLGSATIEVTDQPHMGCAKFSKRFGADARKFVNSDEGRRLRLRGLNARVVQPGTVRQGDTVRKI